MPLPLLLPVRCCCACAAAIARAGVPAAASLTCLCETHKNINTCALEWGWERGGVFWDWYWRLWLEVGGVIQKDYISNVKDKKDVKCLLCFLHLSEFPILLSRPLRNVYFIFSTSAICLFFSYLYTTRDKKTLVNAFVATSLNYCNSLIPINISWRPILSSW